MAKIDRLSLKFTSSIALLVLIVQAVSFFFVYRYTSNRILETSRQSAVATTHLVHLALEDAMLKKDDHLLRQMVDGFAGEDGIERVMILNSGGVVRFSSDPAIQNQRFEQDSPTCLVCHQSLPENRALSTMLEIDGGKNLRVVDPIANAPQCFACHDQSHRINGLVMVDMQLDASLNRLQASLTHLAAVSSLIGIVLLGGTGLVFRQLLFKRLKRFEKAASSFADGDLTSRVPVRGDDTLTSVERRFNGMADSLAGLLDRLRQQQADLERVMNSVDDGMAVLDRGRKVVAANEAFARRLRDARNSPIGRPCCNEHDEGGLGCEQGDFCPTAACFLSGTVQTAIKRRILSDGTVRYEEVRASPVLTDEGGIGHVVEVWRDITDRRSAEAKLADTQRMVSLGMLASGFSHEVNTPLGSIGMCLDGIRRICRDSDEGNGVLHEKMGDFLKTASAQLQRAGAITQQFLRLSRGQTLPKSALDLSVCVEAVVGLCRHKAASAGVLLETDYPENVPTVVANEAAVQQVILNLLLNALDASDRGRKIQIRIEVEHEHVIVSVADEGHGIAPDDLPHLFEPFFSRREGGTGLGLFVSMNFAQGWGGDIRVESLLGEGADFRVLFPVLNGKAGDHGSDAHSGG